MDIFSVFVELSFPPLYHAMLVDLCAVIYVPFLHLRLLEKPIEPSVVHSSMNAMNHAK